MKIFEEVGNNIIHIMAQLKKKISFDMHILRKTNTFLNGSTHYKF